jgi:hypothetical protein
MKNARIFLATAMAVGLVSLLVWAVAAQDTAAESHPPIVSAVDAPQGYQAERAIRHPTLAATQPSTIYLPLVSLELPPCSRAPSLISPSNGSQLDTLVPELVYMRGTDPVTYTVIAVADNPAFDQAIAYSSHGGGLGPRDLRLFENLEPATTYYWRVNDVCGANVSPYSEVFTFTTGSGGVILLAPTLVSPPDGEVGVGEEITFTWNSVSGAVGYQLFRCLEGGGCWLFFTSSTSQQTGSLYPNSTYNWYVRAYNDYAYGEFSNQRQFSTGSFALLRQNELPLLAPHTLYYVERPSSYVVRHRP